MTSQKKPEAARAGEAGAGFAMVADEVHNLAMRAAEAAKNTADLIEGTVKRVQDSTGLLATTNAAFGELAARSAKVNQLVNEISVASTEQAQGVDQTMPSPRWMRLFSRTRPLPRNRPAPPKS